MLFTSHRPRRVIERASWLESDREPLERREVHLGFRDEWCAGRVRAASESIRLIHGRAWCISTLHVRIKDLCCNPRVVQSATSKHRNDHRRSTENQSVTISIISLITESHFSPAKITNVLSVLLKYRILNMLNVLGGWLDRGYFKMSPWTPTFLCSDQTGTWRWCQHGVPVEEAKQKSWSQKTGSNFS